MIRRLSSTLDSFKAYDFRPGLNVVLADKTGASGVGETRNKAGKSSLVQAVYFLLGGEGGTDSLFRKPELAAHTFELEIDVRGARLRVTRSGATFGRIGVEVLDGTMKAWPDDPLDGETAGAVAQKAWREALGRAVFGLPENPGPYGPKFSMLYNYFARRAEGGGFLMPQKQNAQQGPADVRVALSYLLGLDWRISQRREVLRKEIDAAKKMLGAAKAGALKGLVGDPTQLRTQLALAQKDVERLTQAVETFQVLDDYRDREAEASDLTRRINELTDEGAQDRIYAEDLQRSLATEAPPSLDDLRRVYDEAGVSLPGVALERYEEVQRFHDSVVTNRRLYVEEELADIERRLGERERELRRLDARRSAVMSVLQTHGALENHSALVAQLSAAASKVDAVRHRQQLLDGTAERVASLKIEEQQLFIQLQRDFRQNEAVLEQAILAFEAASEGLYDNPGNFNVSAAESGPVFDVTIQGDKSQGMNGAQTFCFDMMLMQVTAARGISPGFLIHDSHLFDPIDGRQVHQAWSYGSRLAETLGFQYIVTINSDQVPDEVDRSDGFDVMRYVLEPRLTDQPGGGLFGFEFG